MAEVESDLPYQFGDRAIREALLDPANLRSVLHHALGELADRFDVARREVLPRTFLLDDWREREADLLLRMPFRENAEQAVLVCILLEHQSKPDPTMPLRGLLYAVLYWNQEWQTWNKQHAAGESLRLTPVLPIVLHTGPYRWTVARSLAELFVCPPALRAWLPQWTMQIWDLAEHPPEELLAEPDGWSQLLAVIRAQTLDSQEFREVLEEALHHLEQVGMQEHGRWQQLLRLMLYWSLFQRPRTDHTDVLQSVSRSHQKERLLREAEAMAQQIWVTYEQEVYARGKAEGEIRGEARGEERGKAEAHREILRTLLERRFPPLPQHVLDRIAEATLPQLAAAILTVSDLKTLDELQL